MLDTLKNYVVKRYLANPSTKCSTTYPLVTTQYLKQTKLLLKQQVNQPNGNNESSQNKIVH